jgi:hypothetical protein
MDNNLTKAFVTCHTEVPTTCVKHTWKPSASIFLPSVCRECAEHFNPPLPTAVAPNTLSFPTTTAHRLGPYRSTVTPVFVKYWMVRVDGDCFHHPAKSVLGGPKSFSPQLWFCRYSAHHGYLYSEVNSIGLACGESAQRYARRTRERMTTGSGSRSSRVTPRS